MIVNTACSVLPATLCSMSRRSDRTAKEQGERLTAARLEAGFRSARSAAMEFGWPESTYRAHEAGTRTIGYDDAQRYVARFRALGAKITAREIHYGTEDEPEPTESDTSIVPVMGLVGAGAVIDPDYEQIPADGIFQVELPFRMPDGLIAFQVDGGSMRPKYEPGEVIVTWAEPTRPVDSFYGEPALVRTVDGRRYLKKIARGRSARTVDLHSFDGSDPIEGVRLEWIGEIFCTFPAHQVRRLEKQRRRQPRLLPSPQK